jgi:HAD superfamily hydrolase (TIGR01484 family)
LIAENGGIVKEQKKKEPLYFCEINMSDLKKAFEHLSKVLPVRPVRRSDLRKTEFAIYRDFDSEKIREILDGFRVRIVDTKFAIHITDQSVNKGEALKAVAKVMNLREAEFAAIGDSENDLEMLELSGLGIAVGEKKLGDVAKFVTKDSFAKGGVTALNYVIKEVEKGIKTI